MADVPVARIGTGIDAEGGGRCACTRDQPGHELLRTIAGDEGDLPGAPARPPDPAVSGALAGLAARFRLTAFAFRPALPFRLALRLLRVRRLDHELRL
jgi:hypothetical protein